MKRLTGYFIESMATKLMVLSVAVLVLLLLPLTTFGQTKGTVLGPRADGPAMGSDAVKEWSVSSKNRFWGEVFNAKYLLSEVDESISAIVDPISDAVGWNWRYNIREEMHADAVETISGLKKAGLIRSNPFLDDYIYQQLQEVHPGTLPPGRSGNIKIYIYDDASANAYSLSDGTILLNVGLISRLRTAHELHAVIAHEVAHVILDHQVEGWVEELEIKEQEEKSAKRKAAMIGAFTAIAAGVATYGAGGNVGETAAVATYMGVASGRISVAYTLERAKVAIREAGAKFNREQEMEADRVAAAWLHQRDIDPAVLATAFKRIDSTMRNATSTVDLLMYATHPPYATRVQQFLEINTKTNDVAGSGGATVIYTDLTPLSEARIDSAYALTDVDYDFSMAPLLLLTAQIEANVYHNFESAELLVNRLLLSPSPSASAYLLAAKTTRHIGSDAAHNDKALEYTRRARDVSYIKTWDLFIEEALIYRRMGEPNSVREALQSLLDLDEKKRPFSDEWIADEIARSRM
ncbi:MAG: M48 family metalloprotease [Bacteroidetes bacterium]|nr:M48 family metalloprotease [Bacteroidota bacterium]